MKWRYTGNGAGKEGNQHLQAESSLTGPTAPGCSMGLLVMMSSVEVELRRESHAG